MTAQWLHASRILAIAVALTFAAADVRAQPNAGSSWEQVDALPADALVQVSLASGDRHMFVFRRATADALILSRVPGHGGDETVPKSSIAKVVRKGIRETSADGALLGAVTGFGAALGLLAIGYANACDTCDAPAYWEVGVPAGAMGAGAGALVGYLIDRSRTGSAQLYPIRPPRSESTKVRAEDSPLRTAVRHLRFGAGVASSAPRAALAHAGGSGFHPRLMVGIDLTPP